MRHSIWSVVKSLWRVIDALAELVFIIVASVFAILGIAAGTFLGHYSQGAYYCAAATVAFVLIGFNQMARDMREREEQDR